MPGKKAKRAYGALLVLVLILIGVRIYLPYFVKDYVNKTLDDVPGYTGSIQDVDLRLFRGAYRIDTLRMEKIDGNIPVPFLDIDVIDLSVQWRALFHGSIVGEIVLENPVLNFAADTSGTTQTGSEADWTKPIKELMPLQINRFSVENGQIFYKDFGADPEVDIYLDSLQFEALNLRNVEGIAGTLPSTVSLTANSIGGGRLNLSCKANILKEVPDFDLSAEFENVDLTELNNFAEAYARLDFEKGEFNLYSEMAASGGQLEGYVKPILNDIQVFSLKEDTGNPLTAIWEGVAGFFTTIFQNFPRDQFATEVPFTGNLNDPEARIWPTIGGIFRNAFIKAFSKSTDGSVDFQDVVQD